MFISSCPGAFTLTWNRRHALFPGLCVLSAAEEWVAWVASLEAEEQERLESLRASIDAFESEETPTHSHLNAVLVSALQGQATLLRASRVFPERAASKRVDMSRALRHGPTVMLACQLLRCWSVLGVTDSTLKNLLRQVFNAVGARSRIARGELFMDLVPHLRSGIDPKAQAAFAAEGSGQ